MADSLHVRDIDQIGFQRKEWKVERIGWAAIAVLLLAALLGVFGEGPLSETASTSEDGSLRVEYDRFIRHVGTTTMTVTLGPEAVVDGKARLDIPLDLVQGWRIESVTPAPSTESGDSEDLVYEFDVLDSGPLEVTFRYRGDGLGWHRGVMRTGPGAEASVSQLIYP